MANATWIGGRGKLMTAKFAGTCKACGCRFEQGAMIQYSKEIGATHPTPESCMAAQRARELAPAAAAAPKVSAPAKPIADFISAAKARGLQYPKARFLAPDGRSEMRLSIAGEKSRTPGAMQVVIAEAWIGRITVEGFAEGPLAQRADVLATLAAIAADPAAAAKAYGALMGRCSFCDTKITDEGSVEVGYGPICAKRFGLPHAPKGTKQLTEMPKAMTLIMAEANTMTGLPGVGKSDDAATA